MCGGDRPAALRCARHASASLPQTRPWAPTATVRNGRKAQGRAGNGVSGNFHGDCLTDAWSSSCPSANWNNAVSPRLYRVARLSTNHLSRLINPDPLPHWRRSRSRPAGHKRLKACPKPCSGASLGANGQLASWPASKPAAMGQPRQLGPFAIEPVRIPSANLRICPWPPPLLASRSSASRVEGHGPSSCARPARPAR